MRWNDSADFKLSEKGISTRVHFGPYHSKFYLENFKFKYLWRAHALKWPKTFKYLSNL